MLGSEVGNYLRLFRGDLYKKYPSLWRRKMSAEERRLASEQIGYSYCNISSNVLLVKKSEVEEILNGLDDKYRVSSGFDSYTPSVERSSSHHSASGRGSKKNTWLSQIPNYSYHLDAVPCATPINRCAVNAKKIKSFPTWSENNLITLCLPTPHMLYFSLAMMIRILHHCTRQLSNLRYWYQSD